MNNNSADYQKTQTYYNKYGSWYDQERTFGYYDFINKKEVDIIRRYGEGKRVLEIGCGTGIILAAVSRFAAASGVDLSVGMLARAKEKGLDVQVANATSLPFPDASFDVVYSFKVLAHIHEIQKAIAEAARVLKPDGVLVLEFYNRYSLKRLANAVYNFIHKRSVYIRFDALQNMKSYLPEGFRVVETHGIKILPLGKNIFSHASAVGLEHFLSRTFLKRFGGYFVIVAKRVS